MNRQCSRRSFDSGDEDVDGGFDDPARIELSRARAAQHVAQRPERLVDEHQAQCFHRVEVPIEGGGHDAGLSGHFTQAERAEALFLQQA